MVEYINKTGISVKKISRTFLLSIILDDVTLYLNRFYLNEYSSSPLKGDNSYNEDTIFVFSFLAYQFIIPLAK